MYRERERKGPRRRPRRPGDRLGLGRREEGGDVLSLEVVSLSVSVSVSLSVLMGISTIG